MCEYIYNKIYRYIWMIKMKSTHQKIKISVGIRIWPYIDISELKRYINGSDVIKSRELYPKIII